MDARLTDEQRRMQETAREFLEDEGGTELARRVMDGEDGVVDDLWAELGSMDYTALTVPFDYGGLGEGMVYLAAVLEAAGRYAMPGPFPETAAAVVPLVDELGTHDQREDVLSAIADGELVATLALYDDRNASLPGTVRMDAERDGDGFRLDGTKTLVPYAGVADRIVVATRTRTESGYGGISLFLVDPATEGVEADELNGLDRTRPTYELAFDDVRVGEDALLGTLHGGGDALRRATDRLAVATTAMLVGAADRAVELSAEYGNERTQYGQPIGRFQAVKHRIADMWMDMQSARSLVYYAAWAIDEDDPDATRATAATKAFAADRLHRVFGDDIWNHGGMGFTWDHDGHIYLKQAKAWRNLYGTPEEYNDRLLESRLAGLE